MKVPGRPDTCFHVLWGSSFPPTERWLLLLPVACSLGLWGPLGALNEHSKAPRHLKTLVNSGSQAAQTRVFTCLGDPWGWSFPPTAFYMHSGCFFYRLPVLPVACSLGCLLYRLSNGVTEHTDSDTDTDTDTVTEDTPRRGATQKTKQNRQPTEQAHSNALPVPTLRQVLRGFA